MDPMEVGCACVKRTSSALNRVQCRALVNTVMNIGVPKVSDIHSLAELLLASQRKTVFHRVSVAAFEYDVGWYVNPSQGL
jgi:hypothetical protein